MKSCPACGAANADDGKFCQRCGNPFSNGVPTPGGDQTVRFSGVASLRAPAGSLRSLAVDKLFAVKQVLLIGRAPECDLCLPHPTVSRHHALAHVVPGGLRLEDLASVNGVLVHGRRIKEPVLVRENEAVGIGPFLFRLAAGSIHVLDSSRSLRLEARHLEKQVLTPDGQRKRLIEDVNLVVEPGEFVSLLGPSGSGKSTLMDCLNGRRPATSGRVLANGEDFYLHFDSFRQSLGYVPQRDIVHTQLSVFRALYYTARLRLPTDTGAVELATRIEEVLEQMELVNHRGTLIGNLSGGQIKRVSLGAELLARPCMLYIDEATSGLDAGTEARMMHLFRHLADEGKSVICITHNVDNVDLCHLILILARGRLIYFGPPSEARSYFGVQRVSEIYDQIAAKEPTEWEKTFRESSLYREFVGKRLESEATEEKFGQDPKTAVAQKRSASSVALPPIRRKSRPPLWHQFWVLTWRYLELIWRDRGSLGLLFFQAPVVGAFILLGFLNSPYDEKVLAPRSMEPGERHVLSWVQKVTQSGYESLSPEQKQELDKIDPKGYVKRFVELMKELPETKGPVMPDRFVVNPRYTYMLVFLIVIVVLWFGCNNAAKEIVKEEAIYGRERAVNLGILPYLASKFLVLSFISIFQTALLMLVIYGTFEVVHYSLDASLPYSAYRLDYLPQFGVLAVLAMAGVAVGLLLSGCVNSPDQANALLPYVLIPQILLGGGILAITEGPLYLIAILFSPTYWGYRAVQRGATSLPADFPWHMNYDDSVWISLVAMLLQIVVLMALTTVFMRKKDVYRA